MDAVSSPQDYLPLRVFREKMIRYSLIFTVRRTSKISLANLESTIRNRGLIIIPEWHLAGSDGDNSELGTPGKKL